MGSIGDRGLYAIKEIVRGNALLVLVPGREGDVEGGLGHSRTAAGSDCVSVVSARGVLVIRHEDFIARAERPAVQPDGRSMVCRGEHTLCRIAHKHNALSAGV